MFDYEMSLETLMSVPIDDALDAVAMYDLRVKADHNRPVPKSAAKPLCCRVVKTSSGISGYLLPQYEIRLSVILPSTNRVGITEAGDVRQKNSEEHKGELRVLVGSEQV